MQIAFNDTKALSAQLDSSEFKALFKTNSYIHAFSILFNWVIIAATIIWSINYASPWLYPIAVIIVGARMHALAILMHDATHYRFLKNRVWNDRLSNYLTMYPIFTSIEKYRPNHLSHHQHLNTDEDPDWVAKLGNRAFTFPKSKSEFLLSVASYFVLYQGISDAFWFLKRFGGKGKNAVKEPVAEKIVFYLLMFGAITFFGVWKYYLLYWVVPYFSTFFMFQYIRSVAEHFGELAYENDLNSSRTVKPSLIERFLIAPHNVGYHLEHHLYPGVPYYNLPKLHDMLMEQDEYKSTAHITETYTFGLLNELGKIERQEAMPAT